MIIFFTILFIFTNIYGLIKGKLFHDIQMESADNAVKKAKGEIEKTPDELKGKLIFMGSYMTFYTIANITYLIKAISFDPYLFPTVGVITYIFLFTSLNMSKKKVDLTTEIGRMKHLINAARRYSFSNILTKLIYISYYGYMFGVLTGLIK